MEGSKAAPEVEFCISLIRCILTMLLARARGWISCVKALEILVVIALKRFDAFYTLECFSFQTLMMKTEARGGAAVESS